MTLETILKNWRKLLMLFLVGGALGWLAGFVFPAEYQATADLYIGLTAYRAPLIPEPADVRYYDFRNLDDYKNWHLEQSEALLLSDEVLEQAHMLDARNALAVSWSNAGNWRLSARAATAQQAELMLSAWRAVAVEWFNQRIENARAALALDIRLQATASQIAEVEARQAALRQVRLALEQRSTLGWDVPLTPLDLWRLRQAAALLAQSDPLAVSLIAREPPADSPPQAYADWVRAMLAFAVPSSESLQIQRTALYQSYDTLFAEYQTELNAARGVSPFLSVEILTDKPPQVTRAYSPSTAALVGALLGVLAEVARKFWVVSSE